MTTLLKPPARKSPDREAEKLASFAEEAGQTRVGKRARHLSEIAALAAGK